MTVVMKIDLVGPRRRGFALGLNEAAGYGGVALAAGLSGWLAAEFAARDVLVVAGAAIAVIALADVACCSFATPPRTSRSSRRARPRQRRRPRPRLARARSRDATYRQPALRSCSQAGLVNNLNDALAWGLVPLFLAAHGASVGADRAVAALYPGVWRVGADRDRPLVRPRRAQAADRRRHAAPGRSARAARARDGASRSRPPRRCCSASAPRSSTRR